MFRKKRKIVKYRPTYGSRPIYKLKKRAGVNRQSEKIKRVSRRNIKFKKGPLIILICLAAIALSYLIFISNYFKITSVKISAESFTNESLSVEIEENLKDALGKNLLFLDLDELTLRTIETFPKIQEININKDYPNKLVVDFQEFELKANIIHESNSMKKNYIVNEAGFVVKEDFENPALPYIKIQSDEPINVNSTILEKSKLDYILSAKQDFEDRFDMKITEVTYKPIPRELNLLTEKEFYVWLDIQNPFEEQFKKLKKALVKLDIYNAPLQYIDLRIAGNNGDKIIYMRK